MLLLLFTAGVCGCSESEKAVAIEIRTRTQITSLEVWSKQYHDDGSVTLYQRQDFEIPPEWDGYLTTVDTDPLRMLVNVPETGRYAFHLVGLPVGAIEADPGSDRLVATICHHIDGLVASPNVFLGRLTRGSGSFDVDGDTFPESLEAFCNYQADSGLPCDTTCDADEYSAMIDCNPPDDFELPDGCGAIGEPADWHPFVDDFCGDCLDMDCYGGDAPCLDNDGDGYPANVDCDDDDAAINPSAEELCGNGIDENCAIDISECTNGDVPCDADEDGFHEVRTEMPGCGNDCDDTNPSINPYVYEGFGSDPDNPTSYPHCDDGVDNNCNGLIDERCINDFDNDGLERDVDCNDCNAAVGPGLVESCGNEVDEDCDGVDLPCSPTDSDRDGVDAAPVGTDCNDSDGLTYPGAPDHCGDDIAQDCSLDQACDDDADEDNFNDGSADCDDTLSEVHPWATEVCDAEGLDEDCDGQTNEVVSELNRSYGCGYHQAEDTWQEVVFDSDVDHCGSCHRACDLGPNYREGDHCISGECLCFDLGYGCSGDVTDYCCPDGCIDISVDEAHCGSCSDSCVLHGDEECLPTGAGGRGECHCVHEGDQRRCIAPEENACCPGLGCTNVNSDAENCGDCGFSCSDDIGAGPRGDVCAVNASGVPTCYCGALGVVCTGTTWCTGIREVAEGSCGCADLLNDVNNCGTCDTACDDNETCNLGSCWCSNANADCGGGDSSACCTNETYCVDLATDAAHCGDCYTVCRPGEACEGGVCRCLGDTNCGTSQVCCTSSGCTDVLTDEGNCGPTTDLSGCGHACNAGVDCTNGSCACGAGGDCGGGETCCDDAFCADLGSDLNNCGACGTVCRVGERCSGGSCVCDGDCDDGNTCTEDPCVGSRCEHHTRDFDDDGYCGGGCRDEDSGHSGDCINGDCDDSNDQANPGEFESCATGFDENCDGSTNDLNAVGCTTFYRDSDDDTYGVDGDTQCRCSGVGDYTATRGNDCDDNNSSVNPGRSDNCNGIDDDCNGSTPDGSADCSGGAAYCCGSPAACRSCCDNSQCSGAHNLCTGYSCDCEPDWENCGGSCNCETGGGQVCCGSTCSTGSCCDDGDCTSPTAPDCIASTHSCGCVGGMVCGGTCIHGATCCGDGDCGGGTPECCANSCEECCNGNDCGPGDWTCPSNLCRCTGVDCGGNCIGAGDCCDNGDCGGSESNCCSNQCEECCDDGDCGTGNGWNCGGGNCWCDGLECFGDECWFDGECCEDSECPGGFCLPDRTCEWM